MRGTSAANTLSEKFGCRRDGTREKHDTPATGWRRPRSRRRRSLRPTPCRSAMTSSWRPGSSRGRRRPSAIVTRSGRVGGILTARSRLRKAARPRAGRAVRGRRHSRRARVAHAHARGRRAAVQHARAHRSSRGGLNRAAGSARRAGAAHAAASGAHAAGSVEAVVQTTNSRTRAAGSEGRSDRCRSSGGRAVGRVAGLAATLVASLRRTVLLIV